MKCSAACAVPARCRLAQHHPRRRDSARRHQLGQGDRLRLSARCFSGARHARHQSEGDTRNLTDILGPGSHGTTFGGSPLACAVGLATLHVILKEDLCTEANELGSHIANCVRDWRHPLIKEVRQHGLFIGFQLDHEAIEAEAGGKLASVFLARKLLDAGLDDRAGRSSCEFAGCRR